MAKKVLKACEIKFKLKELRTEKGLTQEELSELIGLSRQAIVKQENNPKGWQKTTLEKICAALDVDPCELFEVVEEP